MIDSTLYNVYECFKYDLHHIVSSILHELGSSQFNVI